MVVMLSFQNVDGQILKVAELARTRKGGWGEGGEENHTKRKGEMRGQERKQNEKGRKTERRKGMRREESGGNRRGPGSLSCQIPIR